MDTLPGRAVCMAGSSSSSFTVLEYETVPSPAKQISSPIHQESVYECRLRTGPSRDWASISDSAGAGSACPCSDYVTEWRYWVRIPSRQALVSTYSMNTVALYRGRDVTINFHSVPMLETGGVPLLVPLFDFTQWTGIIWCCRDRVSSCSITCVVQQDTQLLLWLNIYSQYVWQLVLFRTYRYILRSIYQLCVDRCVRTLGGCGRNFTYQTSNTQFIDAPEDGPVGPKHVKLSNILWINIQP